MKKKEFRPGHGYSKEDWDAIDSPELTDEELRNAKPFAEVFPELAESIRRSRGPQKEPTKVAVSIRLSQDVLAYYKGQGEKWQSRIDADLRKIVARKR
ncbi:BrnA antitoxin family protein [Methyloferula stellata]|uniref:BrnA antitoxin family protein n=1 Tax=Methyloferula stellata TaxID=876270 RepID=UPI00035FE9B7|nr:BrnA antitoxin family protein [Methyloferula stellata]